MRTVQSTSSSFIHMIHTSEQISMGQEAYRLFRGRVSCMKRFISVWLDIPILQLIMDFPFSRYLLQMHAHNLDG